MNTNLQDRSCQKEFLEKKAHNPEIIKSFFSRTTFGYNVWRFANLSAEDEKIKERQK